MEHSSQQASNFNATLMAGQGKQHTYVIGMLSNWHWDKQWKDHTQNDVHMNYLSWHHC